MLAIYQDNTADSKVSVDKELTNPITMKFTNAGGTEERKLYLRHDILAGFGAESSADVEVEAVDLATAADDVSTWIQFAPDVAGVAGTYEAAGDPLLIGNVNLGATVPFWIKATVPANTEVGARDDLTLRLSADTTGVKSLPVDASEGTFTSGVSFDGLENGVSFALNNSLSEFYSPWIDVSLINNIDGVDYEDSDPTVPVYILYRMADDDMGTNPTAWFENSADLDLTKDYLQVKLTVTRNINTFYRASTDFNTGAQGVNQWYYEFASIGVFSYSRMTFVVSGSWSRTSDGQTCLVAPDSQHPDTSDSIRAWMAPVSGNIIISSNGNVRKSTSSGDGIIASIYKNTSSSSMWSSGVMNSTTGVSYSPIAATVNQGDFIRFRINRNGTNSFDTTIWDAEISFTPNPKLITNLRILYRGISEQDFDIRLYPGPATPLLLTPESPENGGNTDDFNPILTAVTSNGDYIQFQLDMLSTFDGINMTIWEIPVVSDQPVNSQSPIFDRPSGLYYWRARAKLAGVYGNWTDPWVFTINPFVGRDSYIYVNVNTGFEAVDHLLQPQHIYLHVNQGTQTFEVNDYHLYINVNVDISQGEIIYPIHDRTAVRKRDFTTDTEAFL